MAGTYNGWKNYETWNIALWINNDYGLYTAARNFMQAYKGRKPYKDFVAEMFGYYPKRTPDGVRYMNDVLDYRALNSMMVELRD